ncbi:cohesin loading factor-domain-containing protein [Annulohypoxylon truncatum]|uniref:cohesin loading factor-domain-containing protein n=1 Tax=Annulohypoxylon truncatum TaxID=327061 RepID=UPI0020087FF4|nr:cohesin loading factor-domain-containing protein [Annulohypoxylon truncatum]KAI1214888.1 cohesin loading factor-domain-containing protein [Annulohypoxylon truncatum]
MTYRGPTPHGHGSGFNGQQSQYPQVVNNVNNVNNGYDAWGNPQFQLNQPYQNNVFTPIPYSHPQTQPQPQPQPQLQPQPHHQHHHNAHQQIHSPQNANYQFQSYDPSFDQRPLQSLPRNGVNAPGQMAHGMQQTVQQTPHQQQYVQQSDWQHMPPPMPMPSPSYQQPSPQIPTSVTPQAMSQPPPQYQYQHHQQPLQQHQQHHQYQQQQPQHHPQQHQHQRNMPQNIISSPAPVQSPQLPPQFTPTPSNRHTSTGARMDHMNRVSASPRLSTHGIARSPSVSSARSPAPTPGLLPHHADTNSLLICLAEEFFAKARNESVSMVDNVDAQCLHEYQKLVATGLGCLEVVLDSPKLAPRLEAQVRFRYASILCEETNNVMEAETALTKGITLCERNRFADLKYAMHFLQIKLLFAQQKVKAAMIAVDGRIRDAEVMKHYNWVYAFRFLKTSMYLQSTNPAETHALENLKAIANLASHNNDRAIFVAASLLEGLSLLKTMKDDAIVRIQACIAQALKYQLEDSFHIPQLHILALMLDLACSLHQKSVQVISQKSKCLQDHIDASMNDKTWRPIDAELLLPVRKGNPLVISQDTSAVLKPGRDDSPYDYLAMSFWTKLEAFTVTYTYSGLALLYQTPRNDRRIFKLWEEALTQLLKGIRLQGLPNSLADAITRSDWQKEWMCYLYILQGLHLATHTRWNEVKQCLTHLEAMVKPPLEGIVVLYSTYLSGVYHQGTGDLETASMIYGNRIFSLDDGNDRNGSRKAAEIEVSLLATFNRIWIMQHPDYRDHRLTLDLLEQLRPLCADHPNLEIRTAYNLVLAAVQTNPPIPMTAVKMHISTALSNAQSLGNVQTLSIALNVMRAKLFQDIVGDQALKSAKAASNQAKRSGNTLWMSVADGMLAQSFDVQGQSLDARKAWEDATQYARQAFERDGK